MTPYFQAGGITLYCGDNREVIPQIPDAMSAVVTDPPYGLSFMGRDWDHGVPGQHFWEIIGAIVKPGGHLLAFGGTRTEHRLTCAIEDAGFEIRDKLLWLYGSGFPKSLDVGKAIDKANGRQFEDRYALGRHIRERREALSLSREDVSRRLGSVKKCVHYESQRDDEARVPTMDDWIILRDMLQLSDEWLPLVERAEAERDVTGETRRGAQQESTGRYGAWGDGITPTDPATDEAKQWDGWGTALKPAHEPVVLARKPLSGTVASNVLAHGTGAINVDASRVGFASDADKSRMMNAKWTVREGVTAPSGKGMGSYKVSNPVGTVLDGAEHTHSAGRWPANVLLDPEAAALLDAQSGESVSRIGKPRKSAQPGDGYGMTHTGAEYNGTVAASRFFPVLPVDDPETVRFLYCPKAKKTERGDVNNHPTVKPLALMRWLITLVTPPGGVILDPFAGSGSTLVAAAQLGVEAVGIEMSEEYCEIARRRILHALSLRNKPRHIMPRKVTSFIPDNQLRLLEGAD